MTTTWVIQARMGSRRLPGKVLSDVCGRPMLELMIERLRPAEAGRLVIATSLNAQDDPVVELAERLRVPVVRGPEEDVLARLALALDSHPGDALVRLTADCPLSDPEVIAAVVNDHLHAGADYTSNTLVRTYPDGLDVEVVATTALAAAAAEAHDRDEREHVTPFLYRRPERFHLAASTVPDNLGQVRWTIDTEADLEWLRDAVRVMPHAQLGWREILAVVPPRLAEGNKVRLRPASESDGVPGPFDDPARRVWVTADTPRCWIRMSIADGVGSLAAGGDTGGQRRGLEIARALSWTLAQDLQARELRLADSTGIVRLERHGGFALDRLASWLRFTEANQPVGRLEP
jgi:spore coat polysaccharide biosynthesis protein SpsF